MIRSRWSSWISIRPSLTVPPVGTNGLTLAAAATKTREARIVPLPDDLVAELHRVAGQTWLWERSVDESKHYRPATHTRFQTEYSPSTWRWTIQNLFREFNRGRPTEGRLRPHDLRARAFTVVVAATQNVDAAARAMGADPQTARHYLDAERAFGSQDILRRVADLLRPAC